MSYTYTVTLSPLADPDDQLSWIAHSLLGLAWRQLRVVWLVYSTHSRHGKVSYRHLDNQTTIFDVDGQPTLKVFVDVKHDE